MRQSWAKLLVLAAVMPVMAAPAAAQNKTDPEIFADTTVQAGLATVRVDARKGKIWLTLPKPDEKGVALKVLYSTALRTGLGSAPLVLDRGKTGATQLLAFRRIGGKIAVQYENPRFRATSGDALQQAAVADDFAVSTAWMTDIAATLADGSVVIDIAPFLALDTLGIAASLNQDADSLGIGSSRDIAGKGFKLDEKLSLADPASVKVFPDNIEIDALQTYGSDTPGAEVENIAPDPKKVTLNVHHSFVRLPEPGFVPLPADPRIAGFTTQAVDFSAPLGGAVVYDLANRFRLEKLDPGAARSRVKKPIVYYVDRTTPEPIRTALIEGIGWWGDAFDAAGYIDAFQVKILPEGADPLDVRYNMVNWVDRATRGWAYGQQITDPRTGEIVKGMVVLGSLRARQDIQIFQALVGANALNSGGPNDPVQVALARLRQLGAHEVGHTLGFAHNYAASTQGRVSVMDYPPPRITLVNGAPDLSDAYAAGIGSWDVATAKWLYGSMSEEEIAATAKQFRYVQDDNARAPDTAYAWGGLWDDGEDPTSELTRMMAVRAAALQRFGLASLAPGEPMANLRRRFVPLWLLHRYQLVAAAKQIGGYDFHYAVRGGVHEASPPVGPVQQRAALKAILATLTPDAMRVPAALLPLLSSAQNGSPDRQYDTEIFATAGGPVFDPLVAADVAAQLTIGTVLAPRRLARVVVQQEADPAALGLDELLDTMTAALLVPDGDRLQRRIGYRLVAIMAQVAQRPDTSPEVALALDQRLQDIGQSLARQRGNGEARAWALSLSRKLLDARERERLAAELPRTSRTPPGDPIGETGWMDMDDLLMPHQEY